MENVNWYNCFMEFPQKIKNRVTVWPSNLHSSIRKDEMLPLATTWVDLQNIMLSKINQMEKVKSYIISLICGI